MNNVLDIKTRDEFRSWLMENHLKEDECYVHVLRRRPKEGTFVYVDAVEEALCFGWIDSVQLKIDGRIYQRFSPRKKYSPWTELNKERVRRLIKLGLMSKSGMKSLPKMRYKEDPDVVLELKKHRVYKKFKSFPPLYQRVRMYNVSFYKRKDKKTYEAALKHLIETTRLNQMFGEWNDYGRLLDY